MKKTKFFILAGALTFAIAGAFGKKPAKVFSGATKGYAVGYSATLFSGASTTGGVLTTNGSGRAGHTAQFRTANSPLGAWSNIVTSASSSNGVYIH